MTPVTFLFHYCHVMFSQANAQPVSDTVNLDSDDSVHHVAEGRVATRSNSQIDEICRKLRNSEMFVSI